MRSFFLLIFILALTGCVSDKNYPASVYSVKQVQAQSEINYQALVEAKQELKSLEAVYYAHVKFIANKHPEYAALLQPAQRLYMTPVMPTINENTYPNYGEVGIQAPAGSSDLVSQLLGPFGVLVLAGVREYSNRKKIKAHEDDHAETKRKYTKTKTKLKST